MKTDTLRAKLLNCFFAFTLVFGLCIPTISSTKQEAYADTSSGTMTVYYDFVEIPPSPTRPNSIAATKKLLFAPFTLTKVKASEAFLGLPDGCGLMEVSTVTQQSNNKTPGSVTSVRVGSQSHSYTHSGGGKFIAAVKHPDAAQKK